MKNTDCDKLILAVLQGDDYQEAVTRLNEQGFYATVLHSSGGFLQKKSVTLMIGVNHEYLEEALGILKEYGEHTETLYQPAFTGEALPSFGIPAVSLPIRCGGVVLFVINIERHERY